MSDFSLKILDLMFKVGPVSRLHLRPQRTSCAVLCLVTNWLVHRLYLLMGGTTPNNKDEEKAGVNIMFWIFEMC